MSQQANSQQSNVLDLPAKDLLQNLFGFSQQIKTVLQDEEVKQNLALIFTTAMENLPEGKVKEKLMPLFKEFCKEKELENTIAKGVYKGGMDLFADGEAQKHVAAVGALIIASSSFNNVINKIITDLKSCFPNDTKVEQRISVFQETLVTDLKDVIDLSVQTAIENFMGMKLSLTVDSVNNKEIKTKG